MAFGVPLAQSRRRHFHAFYNSRENLIVVVPSVVLVDQKVRDLQSDLLARAQHVVGVGVRDHPQLDAVNIDLAVVHVRCV